MPAKVIQMFDGPPPPRRVSTPELCRRIVADYRRKHSARATAASSRTLWATEQDRQAERVMREITPPLLSDEERGASDSTNGRMKKLLL